MSPTAASHNATNATPTSSNSSLTTSWTNSTTATVTTSSPSPDSNWPSKQVILIGAGSLAIALLLIIIFLSLLIICRRRRKKQKRLNRSALSAAELETATALKDMRRSKSPAHPIDPNHSVDAPDGPRKALESSDPHAKPIPKEELAAVVERMHRDSDFQFEQEFEELERLSRGLPHDRSSLEAMAPHNVAKNRFLDILPFDENRVHLCDDPADPDDYINASYVRGPNREKEYIASQGPIGEEEAGLGSRKLPTTAHFWRMVQRHGVQNIVMLCQSLEQFRQRCSVYWPAEEGREAVFQSEAFGELGVTLVETQTNPAFVRRKLFLRAGEERLRVNQYHYEMWADRSGVEAESVLGLLEAVRSTQTGPAPLLVHCSAGVGRTGTLIALDVLLHSLRSRPTLDVFSTVKALREQRVRSVQTQEQYVFLYDTLTAVLRSLASNNLSPHFPDVVPK